MEHTFLDTVTGGGKHILFGLPATEELTGRTALFPDGSEIRFGEETAVKTDDDLFLAEREGRILLIEELPDLSLRALDAEEATAGTEAFPETLEGWETDVSFASGRVLTAMFRNGALTLRPSPEPVVANPFGGGDAPAAEQERTPAEEPAVFPLKAAETGEKRFLLRFPETGETVFLNARRFLFYAVRNGRIAAGYADVPPRAAG